jgi:hypothetical protein
LFSCSSALVLALACSDDNTDFSNEGAAGSSGDSAGHSSTGNDSGAAGGMSRPGMVNGHMSGNAGSAGKSGMTEPPDTGGQAGETGAGGSPETQGGSAGAALGGTLNGGSNAGGGVGGSSGNAGVSGGGSAGSGGTAGHANGGNGGGAGKGGSAGQGGTAGKGSGGEGGTAGKAAGGGGAGGSAGNGGSGGTTSVSTPTLGPDCVGCTLTAIGKPAWGPVAAMMTTATVGSAQTGPDDYIAWMGQLHSPRHVFYPAEFLFGPGTPHPPPYADELAVAVAADNLAPRQTFTISEFSAPRGVSLNMIIAATQGAPLGKSPDFAKGPILPNALFPLSIDGDIYLNGSMYDPNFDSTYPGYPSFNPPIDAAGPSHMAWGFGENASFAPAGSTSIGSYDFQLIVKDSSGNGWEIHVPFTVYDPTPPPPPPPPGCYVLLGGITPFGLGCD